MGFRFGNFSNEPNESPAVNYIVPSPLAPVPRSKRSIRGIFETLSSFKVNFLLAPLLLVPTIRCVLAIRLSIKSNYTVVRKDGKISVEGISIAASAARRMMRITEAKSRLIGTTINFPKEDKRAADAARSNVASLMRSIPQTAVLHPALRLWFIWQ